MQAGDDDDYFWKFAEINAVREPGKYYSSHIAMRYLVALRILCYLTENESERFPKFIAQAMALGLVPAKSVFDIGDGSRAY